MRLAVVLLTLAAPTLAQEAPNAPLTAIDWLKTPPVQVVAPPRDEPSISETAGIPDITVAPLDGDAARRVGLVAGNITGLPDTLWSSSRGEYLSEQLPAMPTPRVPSLQALYSTILLAEADPPGSGAAAFDVARIDALTRLGALDTALALVKQAGVTRDAVTFERYLDLSLLTGTENAACSVLRANPTLSPGRAHEVFCAARNGDWDTAVLILGTARVLDLLPEETVLALERFLDPELFEGEPDLAPPATPNPLLFRVYAAIGTPIPTRTLPAVYANTDLGDTAGWKARLEAAERLAQQGVLPDNSLLGLYTMRSPAASGGVWDRVAAVQRFETALGTGSSDAVAKTLPDAWARMRSARLAVPFARLFSDALLQSTPTGRAADLAFEVALLSSDYEQIAWILPDRARARPVLSGIAAGDIPADLRASGTAAAVVDAFRSAEGDPALLDQARGGALGAALLGAIQLTEEGAAGDLPRLSAGLATLRTLGLEDVARRTALQILVLDDPS